MGQGPSSETVPGEQNIERFVLTRELSTGKSNQTLKVLRRLDHKQIRRKLSAIFNSNIHYDVIKTAKKNALYIIINSCNNSNKKIKTNTNIKYHKYFIHFYSLHT